MKKTLLAGCCSLFLANAHAQVPKKMSTPIVHKITATWCNPCGTWGWDLADELVDATKSKALFLSIYASSSTSYDNHKFYTSTSKDYATLCTYSGFPSFGCNAVNKMTDPIYTSTIKANIIKAVDDFVASTPVASPANVMKRSGSKITVEAKVKFWSATSGDYYLAAYMVEDKAKNKQNGHSGAVEHHGVMRGSMSATTWGEPIASGAIAANALYSKTFDFTVSDASWLKDSIKIYTVIWKKNTSGTYDYVNASITEQTPTSVASIAAIKEIKLVPNPVRGQNTTLLIQGTAPKNITVEVIDMQGRVVYAAPGQSIAAGQNTIEIPSAGFTPGNYQLRISSESGTMVEKLSVL